MRITADVEPGGYVKVSVLDEQNEPLAESETLNGSLSDGNVRWREGFSLSELGNSSVRIKFEIVNATLYSFSFAE